MIHNKKFLVVMILTIVLIVSAIPSFANSTDILFSGKCNYLEELRSPDVSTWFTNQNELHIRNELQSFECDFDDDRLDGIYTVVINWDVKEYYNPFYHIIGRDYGQMILADITGNLIWEGFHVYDYTPPRKINGRVVLYGRGDYTGMIVKADVWGDLIESSDIQFAGNVYTSFAEP